MSWSTIGDLKKVDLEQPGLKRFEIPKGGSDPENDGNCQIDIIFYKEDALELLNQQDAKGLRLINSFLNTPQGENPIALTFLAAYTEEDGRQITLSQDDNKVGITCPPIYFQGPSSPQPGQRLTQDQIRAIKTNRY